MISVACNMGAPSWYGKIRTGVQRLAVGRPPLQIQLQRGQKKSPGRRMLPAAGAQKSPLAATGRASPPCPRITRRSSEPILAGKFPALAERSRNARRGGDFPVPNWMAAPLRCAAVRYAQLTSKCRRKVCQAKSTILRNYFVRKSIFFGG